MFFTLIRAIEEGKEGEGPIRDTSSVTNESVWQKLVS